MACGKLMNAFEEVWRAEPEKLDATCRDRFRTSDNVNQWVVLWWQIASGQFVAANIDNIVNSVREDTIDELCNIIRTQVHDFICLNDPESIIDFRALSVRLHNAFREILPEKSIYEK